MRQYHVYIMASANRRLYIGVSGDLLRRVWQHKCAVTQGFTSRYRTYKLVYFEQTTDIRIAIEQEKQLKWWKRARKERLITTRNAGWLDLSIDWYDAEDIVRQRESARIESRS